MTLSIDTFLVALYTVVDDLYREHFAGRKPSRPGPKVRLSDSEVLTLSILAQFLGRAEAETIRYAAEHWRAYFPRLLSQGQTNRRGRDLSGVLILMVPLVSKELDAYLSAYQVLDGVPVPLARRCRGQHHRLFADEAAIGVGGADRDFYFGCQLLLSVSRQGAITGFVLGPASTEIHWLAEDLLCWRMNPLAKPFGPEDLPKPHRKGGYRGPTGPVWPREGAGELALQTYISDGGLRGKAWKEHWRRDYLAIVLTPQEYRGDRRARRQHSGWRQVVETVNGLLEGVFGLPFPGAKSLWGLRARIGAKLAAFNLGILLNRLFGRNDLELATIFSC